MSSGTPVSPAGEMPGAADSCPPQSKCRPAGFNDRWPVFGICVFLVVAVLGVFGQSGHFGFVNYDDDRFVTANQHILRGLTWENVRWAMTAGIAKGSTDTDYWRPLSLLSQALDVELFGLKAGAHHWMNVGIHSATAVALFLVLRAMTGALWRSAFVAAIFAIHPLHVESVAWVAERKDVLSGFFFVLTLGAYVGYVRRPFRVGRYLLVVWLSALGLMSKPSLVTLPCVLLLLDYWPLQRFGVVSTPRLLVEKIPLLVMAIAVALLTAKGPSYSETFMASLPLAWRMGNALVSYTTYLGQMFWPTGLAVFYPHLGNSLGLGSVLLSLLLMGGLTGAVFYWRKKPYLGVGWLWYVGMLVPVIGIIQSGGQARADRYTYLPQIGLYVALTWAAGDLCAGWRCRRLVLGIAAAAVITALSLVSFVQTSYWRNSETLWVHTLAVTSNNAIAHISLGNALTQKGSLDEAITHYQKALQIKPDYTVAYNNLGNALSQKGNVDEAIAHFQKALQIKPDYAEAHNNLGNALLKKGSLDEAIAHYQRALQIKPDDAEAHNNLGSALLKKGEVDEAIVHFQKALQIEPDNAEACYNLGNALFQHGEVDEAIVHFQEALQIEPDNAKAHINLGNALLQKGEADEAITHYQKALQIKPDNAEAQNNLAWVLATCPQASLRNGDKAVELARRANQLVGDGNPIILGTLAAAYAEAGRFPEAAETARRAVQVAEAQSNTALAEALRSQLKFYQAGLPFRLP